MASTRNEADLRSFGADRKRARRTKPIGIGAAKGQGHRMYSADSGIPKVAGVSSQHGLDLFLTKHAK